MSFEEYLQQENLAPKTIKEHLQNVHNFKTWNKKEQLDYEQINYRELLGYIQEEKIKNIKPQSINNKLSSISKYYNYLIEQGIREENPARKIRIKGVKKTVLTDRLKPVELQSIYEQYKIEQGQYFREEKHQYSYKRNLTIIGLLIHQGMQVEELKRLEISHIDFDKGEIYIPSTKRTNNRTLKLHNTQIIPLHTYVLQIREKLQIKDDYLFTRNITNITEYLMQEIKGMNPIIRNINQIRASVIMNWVKHHNIRKVQYLAGHKYISSTEKYRQEDVESLQKALEKYHPIG